MSNRLANIIAILLLLFMFLIAVFSMKGDSATMDEVAHLPAGYSYLTQKDMRLNPEHPPLLKDLAAIPLLFVNAAASSIQETIKFPADIKDWQEDINGQWGFGFHFLYQNGNPVDKMLFWGRIPMIFVLILTGFFIFKWSKEAFGNKAALLSLFLFSFSPTFIAHGRLVTTDVGAAAGILIATYYFLRFLKTPSRKNLVIAGIALAFAQLLKFNAVLLFPFFGMLIVVKSWIESFGLKSFLKSFFSCLLSFVSISIICFALIWLVYLYHVWNYPPDRQARDIRFLLSTHPLQFSGPLLAWMAKISLLRPLAQYLLGVFLVFQRAAFGNTTYFLGEVSAAGWKIYFPTVYLIKEPLAFHLLTIIAILYAAWLIKEPLWKRPFERTKNWIKSHFPEFTMFLFISLYWAASLTSSLNIGVRHLLPVFPFTILLVSQGATKWLEDFPYFKKGKWVLVTMLVFWQAISVVSVYPYFLAYFNELVGGPKYGYQYVVDSNLDWGQDLKRLKKWVEENKVEKIYVDYFGGGDAKYYLKEKFRPWWGTRDPKELEKPGYLAVSATFLQGGRGKPVPGFNQPFGYYLWLDKYKPVAQIGYSIFVYHIE